MTKKQPQQNKEHVSNLLQVYKDRLKPPQATVERVVVQAVEQVTGFTPRVEQVTYNVATKTVSLQVPSILKTEIKANQAAIQDILEKQLSRYEVPGFFV